MIARVVTHHRVELHHYTDTTRCGQYRQTACQHTLTLYNMSDEDHDLHDLAADVHPATDHTRCSLGLADDEDDDITYFHICLIDGLSAANHLQVCDNKRKRNENI